MTKIISVLSMAAFLAVGSIAVPVYGADAKLSGKDKSFAKKAAIGGLVEVEMGQLAQQKGQAQEVKDFGSRMVTDHGKANDELKGVAEQKQYKLPTKVTHKEKKVADKLKKASGADFDKQYMYEMVKDHTKDVAEFQKAVKTVKDPDLNAWAGKTLPVLEQHLQTAKEVAQKVGVDINKAEQEGQKEAK